MTNTVTFSGAIGKTYEAGQQEFKELECDAFIYLKRVQRLIDFHFIQEDLGDPSFVLENNKFYDNFPN